MPFKFVEASAYHQIRMKSSGHWECGECASADVAVYADPDTECSSCRNWSGCSGGCQGGTLVCRSCNATQEVARGL